MPFYDYKCSDCGYIFTKKQSIKDDSYPACPECSSSTKRIIKSTGLMFKGQGFYATDYQKAPSNYCHRSCDNPKHCCEN